LGGKTRTQVRPAQRCQLHSDVRGNVAAARGASGSERFTPHRTETAGGDGVEREQPEPRRLGRHRLSAAPACSRIVGEHATGCPEPIRGEVFSFSTEYSRRARKEWTCRLTPSCQLRRWRPSRASWPWAGDDHSKLRGAAEDWWKERAAQRR
jgi:hypothetical protein